MFETGKSLAKQIVRSISPTYRLLEGIRTGIDNEQKLLARILEEIDAASDNEQKLLVRLMEGQRQIAQLLELQIECQRMQIETTENVLNQIVRDESRFQVLVESETARLAALHT
jgi:predicted  nucleic acid-binding Zn-ribbon protein